MSSFPLPRRRYLSSSSSSSPSSLVLPRRSFPVLTPVLMIVASLFVSTSSENSYSLFTGDVFSSSKPVGTPAAFWDTNHDRLTDLIVWDGNDVKVYESKTGLQQKHPVLQLSSLKVTIPSSTSAPRTIVGVIPGDFDGDLVLDLIIVTTSATTSATTSDSPYHLYASWGSKTQNDEWQLASPKEFLGADGIERQPTVLDYDGNTVPDLLVQKDGGKIYRVKIDLDENGAKDMKQASWKEEEWTELSSFGSLTPHSNAFVDFDGDLIADILLTVQNKDGEISLLAISHMKFVENAKVDSPAFDHPVEIPLNHSNFKLSPSETFEIGQIVYVDFNDDNRIDALIPIRLSNGTTRIWRFDWGMNEFSDISPDWLDYKLLPANGERPLRIHMGDYDQDGYTDALALVTKDDKIKVVLLNAVNPKDPAEAKASKFHLVEDKTSSIDADLGAGSKLELVAFFDAYDDGFLDIVTMSSKTEAEGGKTVYSINAFENKLGIDATWIKAMVYTGFCGATGDDFQKCPENINEIALSLPVVGASVSMDTTRGDGNNQKVAAGLLTQFTHYSLQMPTTIFGLGRSPNFVDKLSIGLAPVVNHTSSGRHSKDFEQTIPNSAVVISPKPLNDPTKWRAFIYVTPSSAMLETGIVLSVVFALLAILVGLLHLKEKREDQKEKLVEMQRFHFDAM